MFSPVDVTIYDLQAGSFKAISAGLWASCCIIGSTDLYKWCKCLPEELSSMIQALGCVHKRIVDGILMLRTFSQFGQLPPKVLTILSFVLDDGFHQYGHYSGFVMLLKCSEKCFSFESFWWSSNDVINFLRSFFDDSPSVMHLPAKLWIFKERERERPIDFCPWKPFASVHVNCIRFITSSDIGGPHWAQFDAPTAGVSISHASQEIYFVPYAMHCGSNGSNGSIHQYRSSAHSDHRLSQSASLPPFNLSELIFLLLLKTFLLKILPSPTGQRDWQYGRQFRWQTIFHCERELRQIRATVFHLQDRGLSGQT